MNNLSDRNRGFIKFVVLIVVGILVLSYYNISIKDVAESPASQENFSYVGNILSTVWDWIQAPALWIFNTIFGILSNLQNK